MVRIRTPNGKFLGDLASKASKSFKSSFPDIKSGKVDASTKMSTDTELPQLFPKAATLKRGETTDVLGDAATGSSVKKSEIRTMKADIEKLKGKDIDTPSKARTAAGDFIKNNTGSIAVAAAIAGSIMFFYMRKAVSEQTQRTITKVEMSGTDYKVSFSPGLAILKSDTITITNCPVVPSITGITTVKDSTEDDFIILQGNGTLTTQCPSTNCGTISVKSSVYGQMADAAENLVPDILPDTNVLTKYWWVFLIAVILLSSSSAAAFMISGR